MKIRHVFDFEIDAGELAHGLAHQPGLQTDERIAHLAFEFGLAGTSAATESTTSTSMAPERTSVSAISSACSPRIGLRDQQLVDVDAELTGVVRVERMLGVDEGGDAAGLLRLGDDMQRQRGLPELSGPKISTMRPRGSPPTPSAISRPREPVEIDST